MNMLIYDNIRTIFRLRDDCPDYLLQSRWPISSHLCDYWSLDASHSTNQTSTNFRLSESFGIES